MKALHDNDEDLSILGGHAAGDRSLASRWGKRRQQSSAVKGQCRANLVQAGGETDRCQESMGKDGAPWRG